MNNFCSDVQEDVGPEDEGAREEVRTAAETAHRAQERWKIGKTGKKVKMSAF